MTRQRMQRVAFDTIVIEFIFGVLLAKWTLSGHRLPYLLAAALLLGGMSVLLLSMPLPPENIRFLAWGLPAFSVVAGAIHPKAMPVILTTAEEIEQWKTGTVAEALQLQRPLPNASLRVVAKGTKEDPPNENEAGLLLKTATCLPRFPQSVRLRAFGALENGDDFAVDSVRRRTWPSISRQATMPAREP
jgi:hypothetical protein